MTDRYKVLVIDGLEDTSEVLKAILEPRGLLVEQVRLSDLQHADPSPQIPQLIVFHTQDSTAMKTRGRWEEIPQIVIGSIPDEQSKRMVNGGMHGSNYFLSKPFEFGELLSAIEDCLKNSETNSDWSCEKTAKAA